MVSQEDFVYAARSAAVVVRSMQIVCRDDVARIGAALVARRGEEAAAEDEGMSELDDAMTQRMRLGAPSAVGAALPAPSATGAALSASTATGSASSTSSGDETGGSMSLSGGMGGSVSLSGGMGGSVSLSGGMGAPAPDAIARHMRTAVETVLGANMSRQMSIALEQCADKNNEVYKIMRSRVSTAIKEGRVVGLHDSIAPLVLELAAKVNRLIRINRVVHAATYNRIMEEEQ